LAVLLTTEGVASPPRPVEGNIAHSTAMERMPPIAPVAIISPRPNVSGGSV
jgi:hypothetical protein